VTDAGTPRSPEDGEETGTAGASTSARPLERLADEDLMHMTGESEQRAFALIYDRHSGAAYSLAYRILGSRGAAEDAVQEAFLTVWRSRPRYMPERGSVRTWVLAICHRRSIDVLRRNVVHLRRQQAAQDAEDRHLEGDRTEVEVERREEAREVRTALDELPPAQRKVLELAYFGGFTHREIAGMLEEPMGTIKGRMRLGLQKLRLELSGA
jgi:RNA polymerase sigma-70 factor, ECF subfamily